MKYIYLLRQAIDDIIARRHAFVLGEDIGDPYGGAFKVTKGLSKKYPDNIVSTPMCEQGITAIAIGIALAGDYVIEEIMFGDFITLTADQMINHAAKFYDLYGQKLHMVIRTPSGGYRGYGATHSQSLEKIFLGIPGLSIVAANIFCNPGELLKESIESGQPSLFIENKLDYPKEVMLDGFDIFEREEINHCVRLSIMDEKPQWSLIVYGGISALAVDASRSLLFDEEIIAEVIIASHLNDIKRIVDSARADKILVIEEGTKEFGWGCQVAQAFSETGKKSWHMGASNDCIPSAPKAEGAVLVQIEDIVRYIVEKELL